MTKGCHGKQNQEGGLDNFIRGRRNTGIELLQESQFVDKKEKAKSLPTALLRKEICGSGRS